MILEALYQLAEQDELIADPDYELKPVAWLVRVSEDGKLLGIEDTRSLPEAEGKKKPKPQAKNFRIPRQPGRTSGDRAFFLCDKAEYALGLDPEADPKKRRAPEKVTLRFALFRDQIGACVQATQDEGVRAVWTLLEDIAAGKQPVSLPQECSPGDLFAFVYAPDADSLVHERPAVRNYWKAQRQLEQDSSGSLPCLITGAPAGEPVNFPLLKKVPGGTPSGVALVSFNSPAFESYGWRGNQNAPISRAAAEAASTALNRLLHPAFPDPRPDTLGQPLPRRNFRISADTAVAFWASGRGADPFLDSLSALFNPDDPAEVGEQFRSLWRGRAVGLRDPFRFYALTITGTQGRAILRDWFEASVGEVAGHLARYFEDLDLVRNTPPPKGKEHPPQIPLHLLLGSLAPLGKSDNIPAPLATQFVNAALRGLPFPMAILQKAIERFRAEIGRGEWPDRARRDARAALIKAVLRRNTSHKELTRDMDPNNLQPGYRLGRLMAVLERLQQAALGDVNATVVDRFFGAASAAPQAVFPRLLKNARHHARKAQTSEKAFDRWLGSWLDQELDTILAPLEVQEHRQGLAYTGFRKYLDLEQQGLFILGYHQQRHWIGQWLRMSKEEREEWERQHTQSAAIPA
jgi:CRISPR-associated protein Csd1